MEGVNNKGDAQYPGFLGGDTSQMEGVNTLFL